MDTSTCPISASVGMPPSTIRAGAGACTTAFSQEWQPWRGRRVTSTRKVGGHDIEAFGDILVDLVERAAAAGAGLILDIDDLPDPLEMGGQRSAVGPGRSFAWSLACLAPGELGLRECGLNFLKCQLELVRIELFRLAAKRRRISASMIACNRLFSALKH